MNISGFQDTNVYPSVILIRHFDSYPEFNSGKALSCNGVWDCMFEFWRAWRRRLFSKWNLLCDHRQANFLDKFLLARP